MSVLHTADFRLLWCSRTTSQAGAWLMVVAIPVHVHSVTGSAAATGLALAVESLPALLVGPVAGVFADRWDRRRVTVAADGLRALTVLSMLLVDRPERLWVLYLAVLLENTVTAFSRPAGRALLPAVVGTGPELTAATSLIAMAGATVSLVAPPLGAALYAAGGLPAVVLVTAGTCMVVGCGDVADPEAPGCSAVPTASRIP